MNNPQTSGVWQSPVVPWGTHGPIAAGAVATLWLAGDLTYKLDPMQIRTYRDMKAFFAAQKTSYDRLWVNEWSRRLGKDFLTLVYVREEMLRNNEHIYYYATAFEKDLNDILRPMIRTIETDCPYELRLKSYYGDYRDPKTNSILRLVGLDVNPEGIRGKGTNGIVITEYGYCDKIDQAETAAKPMLVENEYAWRIYNSTPPPSVAHKWITETVPKAIASGGYSKHILDECVRYKPYQIDAAYKDFGGRDTTKSRREYRCEHIGDSDIMVVPEWPEVRNECQVDNYDRPVAALAYVGLDPGMVDLTGIVAGYYDFTNDVVVFEYAEGKRGLTTEEIANLIDSAIAELKYNKWYYYSVDSRALPNPAGYIADNDLRLIADLGTKYGLPFGATLKHDLRAAVNAFRARVAAKKIRILPGARRLAEDMASAIWDKNKTKLENVSEYFGHFDVLMAAIYMHRNIDFTFNPFNKRAAYPDNYHVVKPDGIASTWTNTRDRKGVIHEKSI